MTTDPKTTQQQDRQCGQTPHDAESDQDNRQQKNGCTIGPKISNGLSAFPLKKAAVFSNAANELSKRTTLKTTGSRSLNRHRHFSSHGAGCEDPVLTRPLTTSQSRRKPDNKGTIKTVAPIVVAGGR